MASRTQVAQYVAQHLAAGRNDAVRTAAAWLLERGRARQASYLAKDVARTLAEQGYLYLEVTTARPLSNASREQIVADVRARTGATTVELMEHIDPTMIGGVRLTTPEMAMDGSVKTKLVNYVEGVHL